MQQNAIGAVGLHHRIDAAHICHPYLVVLTRTHDINTPKTLQLLIYTFISSKASGEGYWG